MPDTTTETMVAPVQSPDFNSALVSFFGALTAHENVETAQIQAAAAQHAQDQQTITAGQATITSDQTALTAAQANAVNPAIISSIDAATNALNSGQPLPAFPGAPTPEPIPVPVGVPIGTGTGIGS